MIKGFNEKWTDLLKANFALTDLTPKPILRRLMIPLTMVLVLLLVGFATMMSLQQNNHLNASSQWVLKEATVELYRSLAEQSRSLAAVEAVLIQEKRLQKLLGSQDRQGLLDVYRPVFTKLKTDYALTHFYFMDMRRICLLRVHKPEEYGDRFDRFTALEAELTGKTASGIEIGPLGTFTLRVVQPVFDGQTLIGYLELGKEIEDILSGIYENTGIDLAVTLKKSTLNRDAWEAGMVMLHREADWNRFPQDAVIYSTFSRFPDEFGPFVGEKGHGHGKITAETRFNNAKWRVMAVPLHDASGGEVGDLLLMHDISGLTAAHKKFMISTIGSSIGLFTILFIFFFILLRGTDAGIRSQQTDLRASLSLLNASLDATADGILIVDREGIPVKWNRKFISLWKIPEKLVTMKKGREILSYAARQMSRPEKFMANVMEIYHHPEKTSYDELELLDGRIFERYSQPQEADREIIGRVWSFRDVTERRQARNSLRESQLFFSSLLQSIPAPVFFKDCEGRYQILNQAFETFFGMKKENLIGKSVFDINPIELARIYHEKDAELFDHPGRQVYESKVKTDKGEIRQVVFHKASLTDKSGAVTGLIGVILDITERKQVEEDLLETNQLLEAETTRANIMAAEAEMANIAKSEFLANMSHEIRTPMNGIIGMTGLLLDTGLNDEQLHYTEIVRASGESLLAIINDILDFSKIEAGKLELEVLDFDLQVLLDDFGATMALRAHEKKLELICSPDIEVPTLLRGDPGRLRQILTNLTGNAIKFTPSGEVVIRVSMVSETPDKTMILFSVSDTGIGIPEDKFNLLFDKFCQVDASTTRQFGGTGLGLTISKQLAELMQGQIGVKSILGKGSEFWFTAVLDKQAQAVKMRALPSSDLTGVRVLIVDDNATNREILSKRLFSWGMRPVEAGDEPSALNALFRALDESDPFPIAVIAMQMPGMDGEALGHAIQADPRLAETRMVMLTSLGVRGDVKRFAELGFAGYLTKPARHQELRGVLSLALSKKGKATPQTITTRHTVREALNLFAHNKARILLAEDNMINQQVALGILKKLGLAADAVADGQEVIHALESIPYDLVLMDVQMPVMDGYEATRQIRNPQSPVLDHAIPVIAMTANAMAGDREKCLEAGMNSYVPKPIDPLSLANELEKWLHKKPAEKTIPGGPADSPPKISSSTDIFNREEFLERVLGDKELAEIIIKEFLSDIPVQINTMKTFIEQANADQAGAQAHKIKGAAGNLSAGVLQDIAHAMEKAGKADDMESLKRLILKLEKSFDELKTVMEKATNENPDC